MAEPLELRTSDGIAAVTLNRPDRRNALSIELRETLTAALEEWGSDESVRAVVITGAPPVFCAGFDLDEFARADLAERIKRSSGDYHRALWSFPKPTIAAVN